MIKVAMIGAGSVVFSRNLTGDILGYPEFRNAAFSYMDIDAERLDVGAALCRKAARALGAEPTIEATLDRRKALAGADFVINMVQIGGFDSTLVDFEIPRKYGLNFTIADTTGPGGLFRALRTFPMLSGLARDMQEVCPKAVLLNYSNPMSMNMQSVTRTSDIQAVGLCHSVQGTFNGLMRYIGEDPAQCNFICAGINHMAFFLSLQKDGQDLYPRLFEASGRPEIFDRNKVRFELMRRLGYFVTESSEHNAEYNPWFIPRGKAVIDRFGVPIDEYLRRCEGIVEEFERMKILAHNDQPMQVRKSHEYGSLIIHSMVSGQPRVIYGNMPNGGAIANLPATAIAEAPTLVDKNGLQFAQVGELPPQLVAYIQPHVSQHELFIRAALEGRRDHVYQACMFDPLTAATLGTDQIVEMCDELIAAHGRFLPNLDAKKALVPASGKTFAAVEPGAMLASFRKQQADKFRDYVHGCQLIGPFVAKDPKAISIETLTPLEEDFVKRRDGSVDLKVTWQAGDRKLAWQHVKAGGKAQFELSRILGRIDGAIAYAYLECEEQHGREAILRCGSDDGIRIWINGKVVHSYDGQRGYKPDSDEVQIYLVPGVNRILVKITNYQAGWGFGLAIPQASF